MRIRDLAALAALSLIWGSVFLLFHIAVPELGPALLAELRVAMAAVILLVVGGRSALREVLARPGTFLALGLMFAAIPFTLIPFAQLTIPSSLAAILNATTPLFTAIVAAIWLGTRLTLRVVGGMAIGLVGLVVLLGWSPLALEPATFVAIGASLGAALSYGIAGTLTKRRLAGVPANALGLGQMLAASILLLPLALASLPPAPPSPAAIGAVVLVGVVATAIAFPLYYRVLGRLGPTSASTVTMAGPVVGMAWGGLLLGEPIGLATLAGVGLILVSLTLVLNVPIGRAVGRLAARLVPGAGPDAVVAPVGRAA
jgi:drug/metabolite transporter (DMT)-like permease